LSIILTGASGGIGLAIRSELSKIDDLYPIANKNGLEFDNKVDLTNIDSIKRFTEYWKEKLYNITVIHLAAVKIDELAVFVNEDNWDKVMDINLKGNFLLTKELIPIMMKEKWGRIIHIISSGLGDVGTLTYSTSKFGLLGMSEVLSREYARYGITSNVLQLGYFQTGMWEKLSQVKKDELLNQIPSKQLGDPQNIVNAVKFIIDSPFVNGSVINVDGGV
jgi:3-oxoacyl-[acyl-carrier protein] reductase